MMTSGRGIDTTEIEKTILEAIMLYDINQDLQIVNSEEINPTESTNRHPVAQQYIKDIKNYIYMQTQDMKNYFDKKFNKQAKETEEMKSGFESALDKETEQYRERIIALEKSLGERDKTLYLLFNKIPSPEIQNLSYDERLSWLRIQTSSSTK